MKTFIELYEFLQRYDGDIIDWLKDSWIGKDKQESLLRLFSNLGMIQKLSLYSICKGNFNKNTIIKSTGINDFFYDKGVPVCLKDKGDSSDLTCVSKTNDKHLLLTTSKNLNKTNVGLLDIDKILTNFQKYEGYTMSLCICIRDYKSFVTMKENIESTNKDLKDILDKPDTIIIDWNDLSQAYNQFRLYFNDIKLNDIIGSSKYTLCLKFHQRLGVIKTLKLKTNNEKKILWGHIQRSGKSYIIAGCIIEDTGDNYLVITTAPNETIEQQRKVFDCIQLNNYNIVVLNGKNKKPKLESKNIILCSKQFLQNKSIAWLKKMKFDMRFIDESHNGGTTELAKKTLSLYGKDSFTVQITATYSKPINDYNISKSNWILWDLEDIKLCKDISNNIDRLVEKHGDIIRDILPQYSYANIIAEYSKYPELWLLTDEIKPNISADIIDKTKSNNYGWSTDSCFLLKQSINDDKVLIKSEFQNETENLKLWYRIFGKRDEYNIPDDNYPDDIVFMKRIERICKNPLIDSRFIGEGDFRNEPMIILAFLPQNNINKISKATIQLLEKHNVIPDYDIISINSKTTNNPKQLIEDSRNHARNNKKKGLLVLSGRQCSLGVSIDNCDVVLLLNNNISFDMIYQMMFRCMTEAPNKNCGFVIDLNIYRVIETSIINYASLIKPDIHPKEATKYILQERLINLNGDHWNPSFGNHADKLTKLCENVYNIYSSNVENALNHFLDRLKFKEVILTKAEQSIFTAMFSNVKLTKEQREIIDKLINDDVEKIKDGVEKLQIKEDSVDKKEEKKINYMDILKHIIPLVCLLTIHEKETSFVEMFHVIKNDDYIHDILIDQTKSWWGKSIDSKIIKKFIDVYIKYIKDDKETNQIIRTVKEIFSKNITNSKQLSVLIDKYLIPQELEKKTNAEVSTPHKLRQEMLDKIPTEFWTNKRKVFEPCSGKGGFIIDIIDRFMDGLKSSIPDEKQRYKEIVEECIYFSDINPTNIFICRLLIDPYNEYKLNFNEGNTLELDVKDKWNIDGFDAVIGNPPYNKGKNSNFYIYFIDLSINVLKYDKYLLFVIPNRFLIKDHIANKHITKINPIFIKHTCKDFINISTDIGFILCKNNKFTNNAVCEFGEKIVNIDLNYSTPTTTNDYELKKLSDKILRCSESKIIFTSKNNYEKYIFVKRQWIRYHPNKKGGHHVFQIINEDHKSDGRYTKHFKYIEWYLTRSNIIRFITKLYASNMNVPPFLWYSIPLIKIKIKDDLLLYELFDLTDHEIKLIENYIE